jgi:hypothetical protein
MFKIRITAETASGKFEEAKALLSLSNSLFVGVILATTASLLSAYKVNGFEAAGFLVCAAFLFTLSRGIHSGAIKVIDEYYRDSAAKTKRLEQRQRKIR